MWSFYPDSGCEPNPDPGGYCVVVVRSVMPSVCGTGARNIGLIWLCETRPDEIDVAGGLRAAGNQREPKWKLTICRNTFRLIRFIPLDNIF